MICLEQVTTVAAKAILIDVDLVSDSGTVDATKQAVVYKCSAGQIPSCFQSIKSDECEAVGVRCKSKRARQTVATYSKQNKLLLYGLDASNVNSMIR